MKRKRRQSAAVPIMLFWSKCDQRRFIDAVERLVAAIDDMEVMLAGAKRTRPAKPQKPFAAVIVDGEGQ